MMVLDINTEDGLSYEEAEMEKYRDSIAWRLNHILKTAGMSQVELANRTGFSEVTISRYVNGSRMPSAYAIYKMAEALNVTTDAILVDSYICDERAWNYAYRTINAHSKDWSMDAKFKLITMLAKV